MEEKLKKVMADIFEVSSDQINESSSIDNTDNWDSLKHMKLIITLEESFSIKFKDEEIIEMTNYSTIKKILKRKIKK